MWTQEIIKTIRKKEVKAYLEKKWILHLSLFGSYALWKSGKNSDIDFLFEEKKHVTLSLFELAQLIGYLQKLFKRPVDMIEKNFLDIQLKKDILSHKIDII